MSRAYAERPKIGTHSARSQRDQPSPSRRKDRSALAVHTPAPASLSLSSLRRPSQLQLDSTLDQPELRRLVRRDELLEREADRTADRLHSAPANIIGPAQGVPLARPARQTSTISPIAGAHTARELVTGGEALSPALRAFYEPRLGQDLGAVRLHRGERAQHQSRTLGAQAFTYGNHIWIGQDLSAEPTPLLTHELAHVVHQSSGALQCATGARFGIQCKGIGGWWEENVSKNYQSGKEAAYTWLINALRTARKAEFNAVRAVARATLDGPALSAALTATGILEDVAEVATAAIYGVVGIVVGAGEGAVDIVKGLIGLVYNIIDLCVRFLYGFIDHGRAFDERMNEIVSGLERLPAAMKALFDGWIDQFSKASPERQSLMIGELTGQVIVLIASFEIAATKAGQIPKLTLPVVVQTGDRFALAGVGVGVGVPVVAGAMVGTGIVVADAKANSMLMKGSGRGAGPTPFPRSSLRGVSLKWLRRNKPNGWREVPSDNGLGWKWLDENGVERLRYTRPSGESASSSKWARQTNGYFRWQNEKAEFLDIDGKVVAPNHPEFQELTHIGYEGIP